MVVLREVFEGPAIRNARHDYRSDCRGNVNQAR
jgi:hypothetical protein